MFWGTLTLGIAPLIALPLALRRFSISMRGEFWHFGEWLRLSCEEPATAELRDDAEQIRPRNGLIAAQWIVLVIFGLSALKQLRGFEIADADNLTGNPQLIRAAVPWATGVTIASILHIFHVRAVWSDLRRFSDRYNSVTRNLHTPPVLASGPGVGFRPASVVAGLVLAAFGVPWGLPLMLAAAAQQRLISHSADGVRAQFAQRVRSMLLWRRPALAVPIPASMRRGCVNRMCKQAIPAGARFCPRCGTAIAVALDAVA